MLSLRTTRAFKQQAKLMERRGKSPEKLRRTLALLQQQEPLPARYRLHRLTGEWSGCLECHLEPDWLLIWREEEGTLVLLGTGTHADLFGI